MVNIGKRNKNADSELKIKLYIYIINFICLLNFQSVIYCN